ncbi:MAG: ribonuclease [Oscillospiraceae bacterium]|nr:ribonuclease [Oscillospiraceae bacterium]
MKGKAKLWPLLLAVILVALLLSGRFGGVDGLLAGLGGGETALEEAGGQNDSGGAPGKDAVCTSRDEIALYIHLYGQLPPNFITKAEAKAAGWPGGSLEPYCPGKCIGGDRFGNREGLLPDAEGRTWTECDVNTLGADERGTERIVFSNDGLIFYTPDHYGHFEQLY